MSADTSSNLPSLRGVRILLVEDSWHVAHAMQLILQDLGVVVDGPCATVRQAETLLGRNVPEAAVVDINLQGEMAYELIGNLKVRGVPIIIVSGYEVVPAHTHSIAAVLTKPIRAEALLTELRSVLAKKRSAQ